MFSKTAHICINCFLSAVQLLISSSACADYSTIRPVLEEYCVRCHGQEKIVDGALKRKLEGEVNLDSINDIAGLMKDPLLLDTMIEALEYHNMPPEDEKQPSDDVRARLVGNLQTLLNKSVASGFWIPRTPMRRMNRFQYNNAVVDLFRMTHEIFDLPESVMRDHGYFNPASGTMPDVADVGNRALGATPHLFSQRLSDVAPFPQDPRAEHGFDNRGDHLTLSPLLMESFLSLSQSVLQSADFGEKTCGIWGDFFAEPSTDADVRSVMSDRLRHFLTRAFRRPVEEGVLERYVRHAYSLHRSGHSFTECMKEVASATLASPRFLYLYDGKSTGNKPERLDDFELASRLSFFLWGSIPDDVLLELALAGTLNKPVVLSAQVDRMLTDKKIKRFCDSFPAQWLQIENLIASVPNRERYPGFYSEGGEWRASIHMMLEPLLLFETTLIEDRPILELIDSVYSYRSAFLQKWYRENAQLDEQEFPNETLNFTRVPLASRREGGLFTTAAVMTMTASPFRSKPITRGAWMAGVIFNTPPEPPPADVPPLKENEKGDVLLNGLTLREQIVAHQSDQQCASCHAKIDPFGFALENYGPVGEWRDVYSGGAPVDSSGKLFKQHAFSTIEEFKDAILKEKELFLRGFAKHLLSFALGREITPADKPSLDGIVEHTVKAEYRMKPLLLQIILSDSFNQKYNPSESVAHNE
ncbi:MAG: DUF1592 domain-containing protein [Bacteroidota bacterium]